MSQPLCDAYDVGLFDLDGVLYRETESVKYAADAVAQARAAGMRVVFVTNNASRTADEVAGLLGRIGITAVAADVITAAQATASFLAVELPAGAPVLTVGSPTLGHELTVVGLRPVETADAKPAAVMQGFGPDVGWRELSEAALAVAAGARWVATNADTTLPSPRGMLPGNGALVAAVAAAVERGPDTIVGKPHPRLHQEAVKRSNALNPLVIGDRLDTDIEGANCVGCDSLLVLTGVATPTALLTADNRHQPTYIGEDLRTLLAPYQAPVTNGDTVTCAGWQVTATKNALELGGAGTAVTALRALAAAVRDRDDHGARNHRGDNLVPVGAPAAEALAELGLR